MVSMAVYRVDVLIDDHKRVFDWIHEHIQKTLVVRLVAYKTDRGWYVKAVFKRQSDAELFHGRWFPAAPDHTVEAFTTPAYEGRHNKSLDRSAGRVFRNLIDKFGGWM
jgi:hypothetical protein